MDLENLDLDISLNIDLDMNELQLVFIELCDTLFQPMEDLLALA